MRPQLIPEHENECLSHAQTKMLHECMEEEKVVVPVKLDLCDYQAIELVHPFCLLREDLDSLTEVSAYEALVIKDSSKIGAKESLPTPGPQDIMNPEEIPEWSHNLQLTVLYMSLKLPHLTHHNVVWSLTYRVQLCCIQYRMHGYSLISRANYKLVNHV